MYLDESATEFNAGHTVYVVRSSVEDKGGVKVRRQGNDYKVVDKVDPRAASVLVRFVKNYVAKIYATGDY